MRRYVIKKGNLYAVYEGFTNYSCFTKSISKAAIYENKRKAQYETESNEKVVPVEVTIKELKGKK